MEDRKQEEEIIAQSILKKCKIITFSDSGKVFRKIGDVYKELTEFQLEHYIITEYMDYKRPFTRAKKNVCLDFLRALSYVDTSLIWSSTANSVNLINGVYFFDEQKPCLSVGEDGEVKTILSNFLQHTSMENVPYYSFTQIPVIYDSTASCPYIDKFIDDVFGKDNRNDVYDFIGYLLLPHIKYQRAMILVGSGKNGKTTFLDLLIRFLGYQNVSLIPLHELEDRFSMINLRGKIANIVSDLPSKELKDTGNAKMVVTDKYLSGNIKNVQGSFTFPNRCKMVYSCNKLPRSKDLTPAFFRRWRLFICDKIFNKENIDIDIFDKITTEQELSGLFNRCLEGIARLKANNGFPDTTDEVKEIWEMGTNPVADFILNRCILRKGLEIKSKDLFNAFNQYRADSKLPIIDYRKTGFWLREFGIVGIHKQDNIEIDNNGQKKWFTFYQDIGLKKEYMVENQKRLSDYD